MLGQDNPFLKRGINQICLRELLENFKLLSALVSLFLKIYLELLACVIFKTFGVSRSL
jgi:hypothetical protein